MDKITAQRIVRDTFKAPFDRKRYRGFINELCNDFDESKAITSMRVPDAFASHVKSCQRLGTFASPEGELADVLIVHLTEAYKLERTRTALRDFVAHKLKRDESYKEASLVAFVAPDSQSWRFSYVRMDYETERDPKTGKIKIEERLTPARRYSYLVGADEECHTAQTRFLVLLQNTTDRPTLGQIEEAFSVESVTKEFFREYVRLFEDTEAALAVVVKRDKAIREECKAKGVNTVDFAKKLMGQIVFLYFLQKKGWLGVATGQDWGSGPRDFLRRLANGEHGKYDNFFNDILEPLFYDTLATDRGHEAWCNRFKCRIPFLNGGLFEPLGDYNWRKSDILLPNCLFTNSDHVEEGVTGTGVLDVFDRYNFTVNEAEPLEKEVAIDPEMLGKVFENLIEENRRKGLGAYYTPREIVHYMCQESLINYLDTAINTAQETIAAEKPKQGKLFSAPEPEQQSLKTTAHREIVRREDIETFVHLGEQYSFYEAAKQAGTIGRDYPKPPKSIETHARLFDEKLAEITICDPAVGSGAFPVGMMHEIVRARCALTPYFNDVHERTPYHFKRHAIQNCLYGVDIDAGAVEIAKLRLWLSLVVDEEDVKQIKPLPNLDYKVVAGNSLRGVEKGQLENWKAVHRLETLKPLYFDEVDKKKKDTYRQEIDDLIHKLTDGRTIFDFEIYFSEVFHKKRGFDVAIANPPYISHDQIAEDKTTLRRLFKAYSAFADLYCYFLERSLELLRPGGTLSFITSNSYLKAEYGSNLRSLLHKKTAIRQLLNLEASQVFSDAIVNVAILVAQKAGAQGSPEVDTARVSNSPWRSGDFREFVRAQSFHILLEHFASNQWSLERQEILAVRSKIETNGRTLEQLGTKIRLGVATGCNKAFIVDPATRQELIVAQKASAEIIVPVIRGRDVERYGNLKPKVFMIAAKNGVDVRRDYRAIHEHLHSFGEEFRTRGAQGENWWNLRACAFYDDFDRDKIVWIELTDKARFTNCQPGVWCLNSAYFLLPPPGYSTNYLLAILNSRVIYFYFKLIAQTSGMGVPRWINLYVAQFPIPDAPSGVRKELEERVERILSEKKDDPEADISALEYAIDQRIYRLYDLTPAEIKLVEERVGQ